MKATSLRTDLAPKQREFYYNSNAFFNCAEGAVRSGKTHVNLHRFAIHTQVCPPGDLMMLGRTRETIERNAVNPLKDLWGPRRIKYNRGLGIVTIGNRQVWVVGVNDAQAETKIRGATLAGSYVNELTVLQDEAFDQLYDRHSVEGAKIFGDTNPDSPYHWLYRKWLTNDSLTEADLYRVHFALQDNPFLPAEYVERLRRSHTGLWYKRMVLGQWVVAEGAVFPQFSTEPPPVGHVVSELPGPVEKVVIGADYGTSTVTAYVMLGLIKGKWYAIREYYHDAEAAGRQKANHEFARDFIEFLGSVRPTSIEVDPSASGFKVELKQHGIKRVADADNAVVAGIRDVDSALTMGNLFIHESCQNLIEEFSLYTWNKKSQEKGIDEPIKKHDHALDALRYAARRAFGSVPRRALRVVR